MTRATRSDPPTSHALPPAAPSAEGGSAGRAPADRADAGTRGQALRAAGVDARLELSLVAPVYNEAPNLERLYERVRQAFGDERAWELVLVDDGSRDGSTEILRRLERSDRRVRGVYFAHNCGQTTATKAGIFAARAALVATLDADLQNDPADLLGMLEDLGEHDAVVGWRQKRNDTFVRRASSKIANAIRNKISGDSIRDTGCALKLFRAEAIREVPLFEGMHRFLPTLLRYHGYSVIERPVSHHPRTAGKSKYGIRNRAWRAFKDLLAVRWMKSRIVKMPILRDGPGAGETSAPRS